MRSRAQYFYRLNAPWCSTTAPTGGLQKLVKDRIEGHHGATAITAHLGKLSVMFEYVWVRLFKLELVQTYFSVDKNLDRPRKKLQGLHFHKFQNLKFSIISSIDELFYQNRTEKLDFYKNLNEEPKVRTRYQQILTLADLVLSWIRGDGYGK